MLPVSAPAPRALRVPDDLTPPVERHCLVTLRHSAGARIRVLSGRVWIVEDGVAGGVALEAGAQYVVAGAGAVVVQQEAVDRRGEIAEIAISCPGALPEIWKRALGGS
jgi:DUF2917 family protein